MTRKVFGKPSVEKNMREHRILKNHQLDAFFVGKLLHLKQKPKQSDEAAEKDNLGDSSIGDDGLINITRPAVVCCDVPGLF